MKKILFLTSADLMKSYYSGGEHACKNNLKFLQNIYGKENVDILFLVNGRVNYLNTIMLIRG